jgi:hypothetical protein
MDWAAALDQAETSFGILHDQAERRSVIRERRAVETHQNQRVVPEVRVDTREQAQLARENRYNILTDAAAL